MRTFTYTVDFSSTHQGDNHSELSVSVDGARPINISQLHLARSSPPHPLVQELTVNFQPVTVEAATHPQVWVGFVAKITGELEYYIDIEAGRTAMARPFATGFLHPGGFERLLQVSQGRMFSVLGLNNQGKPAMISADSRTLRGERPLSLWI